MTGQRHDDSWSCGSCFAQNPNPSTSSTFVRDIEVIDLSNSPPRSQVATSIFHTSQNASQFSRYNRARGAEQYRQSAIARTKKGNPNTLPSTSMISATVVFYLLTQVKNEDGILIPISCKSLGIITYIFIPYICAVLTRLFN
jgi:hypothetical protein